MPAVGACVVELGVVELGVVAELGGLEELAQPTRLEPASTTATAAIPEMTVFMRHL